jgi:hypothetical protein
MVNIPTFLLRRFDGHKIEKTMKKIAGQVYFGTDNKQEFKDELVYRTLSNYFWTKYNFDITQLSDDELISMNELIFKIFEPLMNVYYSGLKKNYPSPKTN